MTVGTFVKLYDKGTYIIRVTGHAFTIKDGTVIGNPKDAEQIRKIVKNLSSNLIIKLQCNRLHNISHTSNPFLSDNCGYVSLINLSVLSKLRIFYMLRLCKAE